MLISLEVLQAVYRFVPEHKTNVNLQNQYMSSAFWFIVSMFLIFGCIFYLFSAPIKAVFLEPHFASNSLLSWTYLAYFAMSFLYITIIFQRAKLNSTGATLAAAISALVTAISSWVAISIYELGVVGLLIGLVFGQFSVGVVNSVTLSAILFTKPRVALLKEMLSFSLPLVLSSLGVLTATLIDKVMIKEMMTLGDLGEYGVAARFASVLTLIMVGIQSALAPLIYSNHQNSETREKLLKLFKGYVCLGALGVLLLFISSEFLINFLVGEEYQQVYMLLPLLALAVVIQSGYAFFPGLSIFKKTKVLAMLNVFVGGINIVLNYAMIPAFGLYGAAISTLISSLLYFSLNAYFSEKYYPILLDFRSDTKEQA